jgi:hypothetical protein
MEMSKFSVGTSTSELDNHKHLTDDVVIKKNLISKSSLFIYTYIWQYPQLPSNAQSLKLKAMIFMLRIQLTSLRNKFNQNFDILLKMFVFPSLRF